VGRQAVTALRDLVDELEPGDLLELATGTEAAALAEDLRYNVSLRAFVVTQARWDVAAAVAAAGRWVDEGLAA
jgi:signal transduction histidine kinase